MAAAGLIGQRHIEEIDASCSTPVAAIVDAFPAVSEIAEKFSVPLCQSLAEVFEADKSDGVVLATPNHRQLARGRRVCRPPGVPMIGEKAIGDSVEGVLTGHHRNCSPITSRAREIAAA